MKSVATFQAFLMCGRVQPDALKLRTVAIHEGLIWIDNVPMLRLAQMAALDGTAFGHARRTGRTRSKVRTKAVRCLDAFSYTNSLCRL